MRTLSGGEAQRVQLGSAIGNALTGTLYVLDEPTVGLHPRDDEALTKALLRLRDRGNTVVVVEHEESVIRASDHVVDLGPGAGPNGGRLVAQGTPRQVARVKDSVTGRWLRGEGEHPPWPRRSLRDADRLSVVGARLHNLRDLTVDELQTRVTELREELFNLRFRNSMKQLDNPLKIRTSRREMSRLLTVLREKERSARA
jgi:excinuclease ABC subunit A